MKYLLMFNVMMSDYQSGNSGLWSEVKRRAGLDHLERLYNALQDSDEMVESLPLTSPEQARLVTAGTNGAPVVSDGPFPESKEFLIGYRLVDVSTAGRDGLPAAFAEVIADHTERQTAVPRRRRSVMHVLYLIFNEG